MHNCCPAESSSNGCRLKHFEHANKAEDSPDEADSRDDFDLDDDDIASEEEDTTEGESSISALLSPYRKAISSKVKFELCQLNLKRLKSEI